MTNNKSLRIKLSDEQTKQIKEGIKGNILFLGLFWLSGQDENVSKEQIRPEAPWTDAVTAWCKKLEFDSFDDFENEFYSIFRQEDISRLSFTFWQNLPPLKSLNQFVRLIIDELKPKPDLIPVSLHTELQKFDHRPLKGQQSFINDLIDTKTAESAIDKKIEVIGLNLTVAQTQALFAIQKLLYRQDSTSDIGTNYNDEEGFKFKGFVPHIDFFPADYLEAYGLERYKNKHGKMVFSRGDRKHALDALVALASHSHLFVYKRKSFNDSGEERINRVETIAPLIKITRGWKALTRGEDAILDQGESTDSTDKKLFKIRVEPCTILVDQIDSYFVLKPADFYTEIKRQYGGASKYVYRFFDFLKAQGELKRRKHAPLIIKINYLELAKKLGMEKYIEMRNKERIRHYLGESYRIAKKLGYIVRFRTKQGSKKEVDILELNPERIYYRRELREIEKRLEKPSVQNENKIWVQSNKSMCPRCVKDGTRLWENTNTGYLHCKTCGYDNIPASVKTK